MALVTVLLMMPLSQYLTRSLSHGTDPSGFNGFSCALGYIKKALLQEVCTWILKAWCAVFFETNVTSVEGTGMVMNSKEDDQLLGKYQ